MRQSLTFVKGYFSNSGHSEPNTANYSFTTIQNILEFLERNSKWVTFCQRVDLNLVVDAGDEQALGALMLWLDEAKLRHLNISLSALKPEQYQHLAEVLHKIDNMIVRFTPPLDAESALSLEAINDAALQIKTPYNSLDCNSQPDLSRVLAKQPTPVTQAKIDALLSRQITLLPVQNKISFQNKHQFEEQVQQQAEVGITQSWQAEQSQEVTQQQQTNNGYLFADEAGNLLSWHDIEAACTPEHAQHDNSCRKLGKELLAYRYRNEGLSALWQRITGDAELTRQASLPHEILGYYSPAIPKQISHKTLTAIVRHPQHFQAGVQLDSLPEGLRFSVHEGALYTDLARVSAEPGPLVPRLDTLLKPAQPSAEHLSLLQHSALPGKTLFQDIPPPQSWSAWHAWRTAFAALNRFNQEGIAELNALFAACLQDSSQRDYLIQALNYYHYRQCANQLTWLTNEQPVFEDQQSKADKEGEPDSLSRETINSLPQALRKHIHDGLVHVMNTLAFRHDSADNPVYEQLLLAMVSRHQIRVNPALLARLDQSNLIKLMELALSQDRSVLHNVFTALQAIHQRWGEVGLADFNTCFLTPALNFFPLADVPAQQALTQLLNLSPVEYHWWQQLTRQHAEHSGFADFAVSMQAFCYFLSQLKVLNLNDELPMPCPLQGMSNLQICLNRVLNVLKSARNPAEQMRNLQGLDWSACGVQYAAQDLHYQFVSANMQINLPYEQALTRFQRQYGLHLLDREFYHHNIKLISSFELKTRLTDAALKQALSDFTLTCFFRYIGSTPHAAPMQVYHQFLDAMVLPERFLVDDSECLNYGARGERILHPMSDSRSPVLIQLLPLIAFATTSRRALERLPQLHQQRTQLLQRCILTIYECARERSRKHEEDTFLLSQHVVTYSKLNDVLHACAELAAAEHDMSNSEDNFGLDLHDITDLLQAVKQSVDRSYQLADCAPLNEFLQENLRKRRYNFVLLNEHNISVESLLYETKNLMRQYSHHFLSALQRLFLTNPQSDYLTFVLHASQLEPMPFSPFHKAHLILLLGQIQFEFVSPDSYRHFAEFIEKLRTYAQQAGEKSLNTLIIGLSSIHPDHGPVSVASLHACIDDCLAAGETPVLSILQTHFGERRGEVLPLPEPVAMLSEPPEAAPEVTPEPLPPHDPHQERSPGRLAQQFNNEILWPFFQRAKYLRETPFSLADREQQLYAQLCFVNQIGQTQIRFWTLDVIRERLHACQTFLKTCSSAEERLTTQLTALSLIREAVYKTSKAGSILWPTAVQMLAILSAIDHQNTHGCPLFQQLATGEGKSLVNVFLAILTWLETDSAAVCTHRSSWAARDADFYAPLMRALGINSRHLQANRYRREALLHRLLHKDQPEFSGVFFVEYNELMLIRQQRLLEIGLDIERMAFIVDEADQLFLHHETDCNLTQIQGADPTHPHPWVFEILAGWPLLDNAAGTVLDTEQAMQYLCSAYPLAARFSQDVEFLAKLPVYVEAVWQARSLIQRRDFVSKATTDDAYYAYAAVLLDDKAMPPNVSFNGLVQQALHGILNHQSREARLSRQYPVAAESTLYASMTPEAALSWMIETGPVIALSATLGAYERAELRRNYGFDCIKLPKMQSSSRVEYPELFCANREQQLSAIADKCRQFTGNRTLGKSRAIIIGTKNIPFSEELGQYLRTVCPDFNLRVLHADMPDMNDETLCAMEKQSGTPDHIFIVPKKLIDRGFDVKLRQLLSARQLVVINADLTSEEEETQIKGRGGRINPATGKRDKGRFVGIYNLSEEAARYPNLPLDTTTLSRNPDAFKQRQYFGHYLQEAAARLHRQLVGVGKSAVQAHFFKLWQSLFKQEGVSLDMRKDCQRLFTDALEKIVNAIPMTDFTNENVQGEQVRHAFNMSILRIWEQALWRMKPVLGEYFDPAWDNMLPDTLRRVEAAQEALLQNYQAALSRGPNPPRIKVYETWKPGLHYGEHLKAGKQGTLSFLREKASSWFLSSSDRSAIELSKQELAQKIMRTVHKRADFLTSLRGMGSSQDSIMTAALMAIYQRYLQPQQDLNISGRTVDEYPEDMFFFRHVPLSGVAWQIKMNHPDLSVFEQFQQQITQIWTKYRITVPLDFQIAIQQNAEIRIYMLTLNFSSHAFDPYDRAAIFTELARPYGQDFRSLSIPPLSVMQTVMTELSALQPSLKRIELPALAESAYSYAVVYYQSVFLEAIEQLKKQAHLLPDELKNAALALFEYATDFHYMDETGRACRATVPRFENLADLQRNQAIRTVLALINKQGNPKEKSTQPLLFRQQLECLLQLGCMLVKADREVSLQTLFNTWWDMPLHYNKQEISIAQLMQQRHRVPSMIWGDQYSLDWLPLCDNIRTVLQAGCVSPSVACSSSNM